MIDSLGVVYISQSASPFGDDKERHSSSCALDLHAADEVIKTSLMVLRRVQGMSASFIPFGGVGVFPIQPLMIVK